MDTILHNIPAPRLLLPCQYYSREGTEVFHSLTATVEGIVVLQSPQHQQKGDWSISESERIYTYSGIIVRSPLDGALQINHRHLPSSLSIPSFSSSSSSPPVIFSISFFLYRHLYHTTNTRIPKSIFPTDLHSPRGSRAPRGEHQQPQNTNLRFMLLSIP